MINFHNKFGQIDLSMINPAEVVTLTDEQQAVLAILIEAAQNREAAAIRLRDAKEAVREAMRAEADALAAHQAANPPPSAIDAHRAAIAAFNKANS